MSLVMTAAEVAEFLGGSIHGDERVLIRGVARIEEAGLGDLTFIANKKYYKYLDLTRAGAVLVAPGTPPRSQTFIVVPDPYASFLRILEHFYPRRPWLAPGVHPSAVIDESARVGEGVTVGALCFVGPRCVIGNGTVVFPHVVLAADVTLGADCEIHSCVSLREGVQIGDRVVIHDGAVIGGDGFGFAPRGDVYEKIPQCGRVVIEDDVEIGANTTIDRATLGDTIVGAGTKLDNLIQVGHNASIGRHTVIAAQTGISGSTRVGDRCRIGGQVGMVGHLRIGDNVQIGAQSGVSRDVENGEVISGSPARSHALWKRIEASLTRLPELFRRVRQLESMLRGTPEKPGAES